MGDAMGFRWSEAHIEEYWRHGYTVFRGIVPPSLIAELRRVTDRGRELAREKQGPQTQRFQPVAKFDVEQGPFEAFRDLPELRAAIQRTLSPRHTHGNTGYIGVLIEPAEKPYCTRWHRDWRDNAPYLDIAEWEAVFHDVDYFNQSNCPLYEDTSLWVVPGSHGRFDLPRERELFPTRPIPEPDFGDASNEERERATVEYCRRMPGAVALHLHAGDFALYRNTLWHLGTYVPYTRRATLHDFIDTPAYQAFRERMAADMSRRREAGHAAWEWAG
jgi:ectoine hydroxylase-related dioxygenase (phytanoyl-CoA dioxygenase family)